ncbi:MAG TPA: hypothetical protein VGU68_18395 [Ktedonobacteraceae bacterium]|nr:hypothetical protein [Ktedonobacteraceae bacterium]
MKSQKKSTRMMRRALGVVAISLALLLFSVLGVVALLTSAHANGLVSSIANDTASVTPSSSPDATATDTPTPVPTQPPTPTPTLVPTQAPTPTQVPTKTPPTSTPTTPPNNPTPVPTTAGGGSTPTAGATPTAAALGPGGAQATPTPRKGKPTPTPSPSPTNTPAGSAQGTTPSATPTAQTPGSTTGSHNAAMTPLTASLAGASAFIVLSTTGLVGLVVWRRRKATLAQAAGAQTPGAQAAQNPWPVQPVAPADNTYYSQPTEFSAAAPAANSAMIPFALQGFSQYSPLLGTPNVYAPDVPTPLPSSDFRPLQLDFPQIIGQNDAAPVHTPLPAQRISPADLETSLPQSPSSTSAKAEPASVDLKPTLPGNPAEQPELQSDPFLDAMMQRVQMGIFALPGKDN